MIVIFDIDGTLCRTSHVDDDCWCRAASEVLGVDGMTTDWGAYPHSTDEAIACALIEEHLGAEADRALLDRLRDRFVELLYRTHAESPNLFQPTPGAGALIEHLRSFGVHLAIATGGWKRSALFKLQSAGLPVDGVPAAFADDAHPREDIITIARQLAADAAGIGVGELGDVVYVGDGLWDLRASKRLGIGFVGIADGERARDLAAAGAKRVLVDFVDTKRFMDALDAGGA